MSYVVTDKNERIFSVFRELRFGLGREPLIVMVTSQKRSITYAPGGIPRIPGSLTKLKAGMTWAL